MENEELEEPSPDRRVGERMKSLRETADVSQEQVSKEMRDAGFKWSNRTVWQVESGTRPLRLVEAEALITVLRTPELQSVDQLLQTPTAQHLAANQKMLLASTRSLKDALTQAFSAYMSVERELVRASSNTHDHDARTSRLIERVFAGLEENHPLWTAQKWIAFESEESALIDEALPQELGELLERHRSSLSRVSSVNGADREAQSGDSSDG